MSETFEQGWLDLREPVDSRSREAMAATLVAQAWQRLGWQRVVDLGTGTGANVRYLSPRLPGPQAWTLVDRDPALLASVRVPPSAEVVAAVENDLAPSVADIVDSARADLVTASALLDLVSEAWLSALVDACVSQRRGAYFALNYDGLMEWHLSPSDLRPAPDPDDAAIRRAVNRHQRRDKGFGPALGSMAGLRAETALRGAGYQVWNMQSPWRLGVDDAELVGSLIDGWERAVLELGADDPDGVEADRVRAWAVRRRETVERGDFGLSVGHLDLVALPGRP